MPDSLAEVFHDQPAPDPFTDEQFASEYEAWLASRFQVPDPLPEELEMIRAHEEHEYGELCLAEAYCARLEHAA